MTETLPRISFSGQGIPLSMLVDIYHPEIEQSRMDLEV